MATYAEDIGGLTPGALSLFGGAVTLPKDQHVLTGLVTNPVAPVDADVLVLDGNYDVLSGPTATLYYGVNWVGQPTGYRIVATLTSNNGRAGGTCGVEQYVSPGEGVAPYWAGVNPSPFVCNVVVQKRFPNAQVEIQISRNLTLDPMAQAQTLLQTQGPISLQDGSYYADQIGIHFDGTPTVGENSSSLSWVALMPGDAPIQTDRAKTRFIYRIVDAGLVRPFWVKGYAENFDGWSKYTGGSDCGIYDQNPET
ncbi:MAG: hypothetical protein ABI170_05485, partial [Microbacteriaceae bacterium]